MYGINIRFVVAGAAALFIVALAVMQVPLTVNQYPVDATVTADAAENISIGLSVDTDRVAFGQLPQDARAEKMVRVQNNEDQPLTLQVAANGNISQYLQLSADETTAQPGDTVNVTTVLETAADTPPGYYTGSLLVTKRAPLWRVILR